MRELGYFRLKLRDFLIWSLKRVSDEKDLVIEAPRYFIPDEHYFSHKYCFLLHDLLTDIVVQGEKDGIFNIHVKLKDEETRKQFEEKSGRDFVDWLEQNGFELDVIMLIYKTVCLGLLSDLCHFVYEALKNSEKGKLTIAYALLRKPFVENLFYLEWLLADPVDFLKKFKGGEISALEIYNVTPERKKEIIKKAMEEADSKYWADHELIYELRYNKSSEQSFQSVWQQANHLITAARQYRTESTNFNFVFSGIEEKESQWTFLYSYLPILLHHAYEVVEALIANFAKRACHETDITDARVQVGFELWLKNSFWADHEDIGTINRMTEILKGIGSDCPRCNQRIEFDEPNMYLFYWDGALACPGCKSTVPLINEE